jgi:hypothetical protein
MPFDHAEFTRDVREIVAQVPEQRDPDSRPIEPAGTVIEVEGIDGRRMQFVSNGHVWLGCIGGGDTYRGLTSQQMNRAYVWWVVSGVDERMSE